ncbi:DUF3017 domain-containing protein [Streptomyces sp. NPDC051569]|uniref:DUF3017 domain-containing protein n=1 Tax=Streptomyces sp. NPDC051569 TaxID=3365661 RepID=UPI00378D2421
MGAGTSAGDAARSPRRTGRGTPAAAAKATPVRDVPEPVSPDLVSPDPVSPDPAAPVGPDAPATDAPATGTPTTGTSTADAPGAATLVADGLVADGPVADRPSDAAADPEGADEQPEERAGRFAAVTLDTARPEGGGRAAPSDAPAPVRQWPLISVLGTIGLGLLIVGLHPFAEAFRIGTILIGVALIGGACLRRAVPSVGMLAVRSRFTDMVTYTLLGTVIVLLALMTQPRPWLEIPFLEDIVHSTVP